MGAVYCAECRAWEPCRCSRPGELRSSPARPIEALVMKGVLSSLRFWAATPKERRAMVKEALDAIERARVQ